MRRTVPPLLLLLAVGPAVLHPAAFARPMKGDPTTPDEALGQLLGGRPSGGSDVGKAVGTLAATMGDISADLSRRQTDAPVQAKQKRVGASLDTLIADLERQCNGGGGGNMNPTQGLRKSILAGGPGGIGDLRDARAGEKQWGALKAKDREQILQAKTDGFPAGYESLLQSYYRRLSAEDNTTPAAPPTAVSTAAPTPPAPTTAPAGAERP